MTLHCPECRHGLEAKDCVLVRLGGVREVYVFRCPRCGAMDEREGPL